MSTELDPATLATQSEQTPSEPFTDGELLASGTKLGRYAILGHVSSGGMGVVYEAYDPELDRRVALKLLRSRPRRKKKKPAALAQARLLREARALAKLSHPNVIPIYDAGEVGRRVFIAMEFVRGETLRAWCERPERTAQEIIEQYVAAGRGLWEAHQVGLVHRDFKPENVLVGEDGRARVLDFGLVTLLEDEEASRDSTLDSEPDGRVALEYESGPQVFKTPLTEFGARVGTPLYMAPEQHLRLPVDARADQFSFCLALLEALCGRHPYEHATYAQLVSNVRQGRLRDLARPPGVSPRIMAAIHRGLRPDADDRFPSLVPLLAELQRDPAAARRRRVYLAAACAVGALAVFAILRSAGGSEQRCQGARSMMAGVWDETIAERLHERMAATGKPYAEDVYQRLAVLLDKRADEWVHMRADSCQATHVRGDQSAQLLDLRTQCLDGRLQELRALTALFSTSDDPELADHALQGVYGMATLERCADAEALVAAIPPPEDAAVRARVAAISQRVNQAKALSVAGHYAEALPIMQAAVGAADELQYAPLAAQVQLRLADLLSTLGQVTQAAETAELGLSLAARSHDHNLYAEAALLRLTISVVAQARFEEGTWIQAQVDDAIVRAGDPPRLRAQMLQIVGELLAARGQYKEGLASNERALSMLKEVLGERHPEVATAYKAGADALRGIGENERAAEYELRALAILEQVYGPGHPEVAAVLNNLSFSLTRLRRFSEARAYSERALAIQTAAFGPDHPTLGGARNNLASALIGLGELEPALEHYREALAIKQRTHPPGHPTLAIAYNNMGIVLDRLGRYEEALDYMRRGLAVKEAAFGPDHLNVARSLENVGYALARLGRHAEAQAAYRRVLAIRERELPPDNLDVGRILNNLGSSLVASDACPSGVRYLERAHIVLERAGGADYPELGEALRGLGVCALEQRDVGRALPLLERAVAIAELDPSNRREVAASQFALARALWKVGGQSERALQLADAARRLYASMPSAGASEQALIDRWLAKIGRR